MNLAPGMLGCEEVSVIFTCSENQVCRHPFWSGRQGFADVQMSTFVFGGCLHGLATMRACTLWHSSLMATNPTAFVPTKVISYLKGNWLCVGSVVVSRKCSLDL